MDPTATNYDAIASLPGACDRPVEGCSDSRADNYYARASSGDSSLCHFTGCTDSSRANYDPLATIDDGFCDPVCTCHAHTTVTHGRARSPDALVPHTVPVAGPCALRCTPSPYLTSAVARLARGSIDPGCTNPKGLNYNAAYNRDDGSCTIVGCDDATDARYDAEATLELPCWCATGGCR